MKANKFLILIMYTMITISVVSTIYGFIEASSMELCWSCSCYKNFILIFGNYKEVYSATFAVIAIYIAIDQLLLSRKTSYDAVKISYKEPWTELLKERLSETKEKNTVMYNLFTINLSRIYDFLFECDFKFSSKETLEAFMNKFIVKTIPTFEELDQNTFDHASVYRDRNQLHSFNTFWDLIIAVAQPQESYTKFYDDLYAIYLNAVSNSPFDEIRTIDPERYVIEATRASDIRLQRRRDEQKNNGR